MERQISPARKIRIKAGLLVIILAVLLSNVQSLMMNINLFKKGDNFYPQTPPKSKFVEYEKRFTSLKKALPVYGEVGYFSDIQGKRFFFEHDERFFLAQYVLAPLVVVNSINQDFVIGNFTTSSIKPEMSGKLGLILVKDFKNGVILFRKENK